MAQDLDILKGRIQFQTASKESFSSHATLTLSNYTVLCGNKLGCLLYKKYDCYK